MAIPKYNEFIEKNNKVNEEFVQLMYNKKGVQAWEFIDDIVKMYKEWYVETNRNWSKDDEIEFGYKTVDDMAKAAKIELIEYLVDELNKTGKPKIICNIK